MSRLIIETDGSADREITLNDETVQKAKKLADLLEQAHQLVEELQPRHVPSQGCGHPNN